MASGQSRFDQIKAVSAQHANSIAADIIFYSGEIGSPKDLEFVKFVGPLRQQPNVMLVLTTNGGSADSAYRIARCLQREYNGGKFTLFVDGHCKSAGTLLALGADELVMSDTAELGPLDVQLSKPDELFESVSGLTPTQAISALREQAFSAFEDDFLQLRLRSGLQITTKAALEIAAKLVTGIFEPVFAQLDPMKLGEIHRATQIALQYGRRLIRKNAKQHTLEQLVHDYPSHGFVIDREEASQLFDNVREPSDAEVLLAQLLEPFMEKGQEGDEPVLVFLSHLNYNSEDEDGDGRNGNESSDGESVSRTAGTAGPAHSAFCAPAETNSDTFVGDGEHDQAPGSDRPPG